MASLEGAVFSAAIVLFVCLCFTPQQAKAEGTQTVIVVNPIEYDKMRMQCRGQFQNGVIGPNTYAVDLCIGKVNDLEKARTGTYPGEIKY